MSLLRPLFQRAQRRAFVAQQRCPITSYRHSTSRAFSTRLAFDIESSGASSEERQTAVVLHGIMGNHKNLRSISHRLAHAHPNLQMLLVTLRGHGESDSGSPPHTLATAAQDVLGLVEHLRNEGRMTTADAFIGHSFGGKTVLEMTKQLVESEGSSACPSECFVLDALPGKLDAQYKLQSEVANVLSVLHEVPNTFVSKEELIDVLMSHGLSLGLAQWMTTNVVRKDGIYKWTFDLDVLEALYLSLVQNDYWPFIESGAASGTKVTFVRAERNNAWTPEVVERLEALPSDKVECLLLKDSGHWVHADQPDALFELLSAGIRRISKA